MLETVVKRVRMLVNTDLPRFPSLVLTADDISAQGPFAVAQAQFLEPNEQEVCLGVF